MKSAILLAPLLALVVTIASTAWGAAGPTPTLSYQDPSLMDRETTGKAHEWVVGKNRQALEDFSSFKFHPEDGQSAYDILADEAKTLLTQGTSTSKPKQRGKYVYQFALQDPSDTSSVIWRRTRVDAYGKRWENLLTFGSRIPEWHGPWPTEPTCIPYGKSMRCLFPLEDMSGKLGPKNAAFKEYDLKRRAFVADGLDVTDLAPSPLYYARYVDADTMVFFARKNPDPSCDCVTDAQVSRFIQLKRRNQPDVTIYEVGRKSAYADLFIVRDNAGPRILVAEHVSQIEHRFTLINPKTLAKRELPIPGFLEYQGSYKNQILATTHQEWVPNGKKIAPGSVVALPLDQLSDPSVIWSPSPLSPGSRYSRGLVNAVLPTRSAIYLGLIENVQGSLLRVDLQDGQWKSSPVALPGIPGNVRGKIQLMGIDPTSSERDDLVNSLNDGALFSYDDYLTPNTLFRLPDGPESRPLVVEQAPALFDASQFAVEQRSTLASDGTPIPYFLLHRKDMKLDGKNPTILYGYGFANAIEAPLYVGDFGKLWLAHGGAYAIANLRGGGEFGPLWNQDGDGLQKQRSIDDFVTVAKDLISSKITDPKHLGIKGVSCGGFLASATLNQHPELFAAVKSEVGVQDTLHMQDYPGGELLAAWFGDPKSPEFISVASKTSPLQNIRADLKYPPVFYEVRTWDKTLWPAHSRRMALRMEELGHPVFYTETFSPDAEHTGPKNLKDLVTQRAMEYAFFWKYLSQK